MFTISIVDTLTKKAATALGSYFSSLVFMGLATIPLLIVLVAIPPTNIAPVYLLYAVLGGLAYALGLVLVFKSLETEQASNTWSLANIGLVPLILLGAFVLSEPVDLAETAGIFAVIIGSVMITVTKDMNFNRKLIPAIIGNVLFAVYFLLTAYAAAKATGSYTTIFPISYTVAFVSLFVYGTATSKLGPAYKKFKKSNLIRLVLFIGLVGGLSQSLFLFVIVLKTVALGSAIQVFEPALVITFAYLLYKERMTPLQLTGVLISLIGALTVSIL